MGPGETGGGHRGEQLHEAGAALGVRGPGQPFPDQVHRGVLDQMPGGAAVGIADDGGALDEGAWAGDPGAFQGRAAGQGGVSVVEPDEGGGAADGALDQGPVDGPAAEGVVVQAPGDDPALGPFGRGQCGAQLVEVADGGEVGAGGHLQPPDGVAVRVDQAGREGGPGQVDVLGAVATPLAQPGLVADGGDHPVLDRHGGGLRPGRVEGADTGSGEEEVGCGHGGAP